MFLICTVLAFFLANVASSGALDDDVKAAFEELNSYSGRIVWNDELAKQALKYLKSPDSVTANLVIKEEMTIPKDDPSSMGMKIYNSFRELFETEGTNISALPEGSQYGCNFQSTNNEVLKIACLYN
uniref:SCP extracellular domain containing protein n=1 Tax=Haemonchus contortus TaxID=6289 RepID=A0A7I4YYE8_HAECO